jgi:hypothetical protein
MTIIVLSYGGIMPAFERIDINKKRRTPPIIIIVLFIAVLFGTYIRSCWKKQQDDILQITNIEISEYTPGNIDIRFKVKNLHDVELDKAILIKVYDIEGFELASKLTNINIAPQSNKTYLKVLTKFNRPINENNKPEIATVEIYKP